MEFVGSVQNWIAIALDGRFAILNNQYSVVYWIVSYHTIPYYHIISYHLITLHFTSYHLTSSDLSVMNFQDGNPLSMMSSVYRGRKVKNGESVVLDENDISTLSLYNSFTGTKVLVSSYQFTNIGSFKKYVSAAFHIPDERLFFLTSFGIKLTFAMLVHEEVNQIFVYDRRFFDPALLNPETAGPLIESMLTEVQNSDLVSMIKPLPSPLTDPRLESIVSDLSSKITASETSGQKLNSTQIDLAALRTLLSFMRRNVGWESAILSDFKSTVFDENSIDGSQEVKNILTSLNVLIQYISATYKEMEKLFNKSVDDFILLQNRSAHETWMQDYGKLSQLRFKVSPTDGAVFSTIPPKNNDVAIPLSSLVDENDLSENAAQAEKLIGSIKALLARLRAIIRKEVSNQRKELLKEYKYYTVRFVKKADKAKDEALMAEYNAKLEKFKALVESSMLYGKNLPQFEELITTTSADSSFLSPTAILKIKRLVTTYKQLKEKEISRIAELATQLYQIQTQKFSSRHELQEKIVRTTLSTLISLQLKMLQANKFLSENIGSKLENLRNCELQLAIVADLPLAFGILIIAFLGNKKHGMCLEKLSHKSFEVIEMMSTLEKGNRETWLAQFMERMGADQPLFKFDKNLKAVFVNKNLPTYGDSLVRENSTSRARIRSRSTNSANNTLHTGYLDILNNILKHINGRPSQVSRAEQEVPNNDVNALAEADPISQPSIFEIVGTYVSVTDVVSYIKSLESVGVDKAVTGQLQRYLSSLSVLFESSSENTSDNKGVELNEYGNFGSMDASDKVYTKFLRKYLKSFETQGLVIDVKEGKAHQQDKKQEALVEGYKIRIKKLENLLHEQTYKQFSDQWSHHPVMIQFNEGGPDGHANGGSDKGNANDDDNAIELNRKVVDLPPSVDEEKIKKLEVENQQLKAKIQETELAQEGGAILKMKQEIKDLTLEVEGLQKEREEKIKEVEIFEKQTQVFVSQREKTENKQAEMEARIKELEKENEDVRNTNNDLIENLSQKEKEFSKESQINQCEINELKLKIEELEDDRKEILETGDGIVQGGSNRDDNSGNKQLSSTLSNAATLVESVILQLATLVSRTHEDMVTFCLLLESIGLMLELDGEGRFVVQRVKGLRGMKKKLLSAEIESMTEGEIADSVIENALLEVVAEEVVQKSAQNMEKLQLTEMTDLCKDEDKEIELVETQSEVQQGQESATNNKVLDSIKVIVEKWTSLDEDKRFKEFMESTFLDRRMLVEKVFKRFNDVETLARRLQKEKNAQRVDITSLRYELSHRLAIRNFKNGDLVLFLRTLNPTPFEDVDYDLSASDRSDEDEKEQVKQPWAIFNMGAPNYYLRELKSSGMPVNMTKRDWFVGRITKIDTMSVNDGNYTDKKLNPFKLAIGFTWYFVDAEEEVDKD